MMRLLVLVLLLANGAYFAWSHDYLRAYGLGPAVPNEPQRLAQQVKPEAIVLLSPQELAAVEARIKADALPKECLQAGPWDEAQAALVRKALAAWPADSWRLDVVQEPARWIVYMGQFANRNVQARKQAELARMRIDATPVSAQALQPGLTLGHAESEGAAQAQLANLEKKGIRTAKVVMERDAVDRYQLRLPAVTEAVRSALPELKSAMAGRTFKPCN